MTEETNNHPAEEISHQAADDRYEVKWRKKEGGPPPPPAPEQNAQPADAADLQAQLDEANARIRDLQDRWQRAQADLVNLRRRTEQEKGEVEQFASMLLVQEILPVLDNFERALSTIPESLRMFTWIHGVMLMERHLQSILERQGLKAIDAKGTAFDPHLHEAVAERETAEAEPGTIVAEFQRGYTMHGRVIRPTLVELAKAPTAESAADSDSLAGQSDVIEQTQTGNIGP